MSMKKNAFLVGSFLIAGLALIAGAIIWLSGSSWLEPRERAVIYFVDGVSGLYVGAPVTFRGVQIGEVQTIGLRVNPQTGAAHMPVQIALRPKAMHVATQEGEMQKLDVDTLVAQGLRARLVAQSFVTGQKLIDLDFAPMQPPTRLGPANDASSPPEIPTQQGMIDALLEQAGSVDVRSVVAEFRTTIQSLDKTLNSANLLLNNAHEQLSSTAAQTRNTLQAGTDALNATQTQAAQTLRAIEQLSKQAHILLKNTQAPLQASLESVKQTSDSARLATDNAQRLIRNADDFLTPDAKLRVDLEATLRDLSIAARNLRDWSDVVAEHPNALIFGQEHAKP
jgi:paraquat-inducible protein B